ncbi:hypothetical protein ACIBL8_21705 [Streptomyces sp. NPDC050523]|uniref:hypothetical protein n=1 Tax=Streptomyces sp. NPDC050523 TaxID=3365622 RepID=UPI0037B77251
MLGEAAVRRGGRLGGCMWGPDKLWHWYQTAHSPAQQHRQERSDEDLGIGLRVVFLEVAPWLDIAQREQLINIYLAVLSRGGWPVWMRDRAKWIALVLTWCGGACVAAGLMAVLDSGVVGALDASLGEQLLALASVASAAALLTHPRAALETARRAFHPESDPMSRFDPGVVALVTASAFALAGLPWSIVFLWSAGGEWGIGWIIFVSVAAGMGHVASRWWNFYENYQVRHICRDEELALDYPTVALLELALIMGKAESDFPLGVKDARGLCSIFRGRARSIEFNPAPRRAMSSSDRPARKALRERHARIAGLVRAYGNEIGQGITRHRYRKIEKQLAHRALAASQSNWNELLANAPQAPLTSRLRLVLHRTAAPVALTLAALIVPIAPGVGDAGTGIRTSLLAMAVLFAIPVGDGARDTASQIFSSLLK